MSLDAKRINKFRGKLPNTLNCFVCGEKNKKGLFIKARVEAGIVICEYVTSTENAGWSNMVHGGVSMALLDEIMTWAAILETGKPCVAGEFKCRFKKPIYVGEKIIITGWVNFLKSILVSISGKIVNSEGNICVEGEGKYITQDREFLEKCKNDFVYSDTSIDIASIFE